MYVMQHHRGALRASLKSVYGVDLSRARELPLVEVIDLVIWLPPGCPLWLATGGPASLTGEEQQLRGVVYVLQVILYKLGGNKGKRPEPPKDPEYDHERRARDVLESKKGQRWLKRHQ